MEPADPEAVELDEELHARIPLNGWSVWRGLNGVLYARPYKQSPPVLFQGATPAEVLAQVGEWVATGRRPDDPEVLAARAQRPLRPGPGP